MQPNRRMRASRTPRLNADVKKTIEDISVLEVAEDTITKKTASNAAENAETVVFDVPSTDKTVVFTPPVSEESVSEYADEKVVDVSVFEPKGDYNYSFDQSLEFLTADQIDPEGKNKRGGLPIFTIVRTMMIVICLSIFAYCAFVIADTLIDYQRSDAIYDQFADKFFSFDGSDDDGSSRLNQVNADGSVPNFGDALDGFIGNGGLYVPPISSSDNPFDTDPDKMVANLTLLREIAPDLYGWIYVAGTTINYPIVQSGDNVYYLDHDAARNNLNTGAIFADFRCDKTVMGNFNTVLYGHNIRSNQMFHAVQLMFENESLFRNKEVIICTFDGVHYYKTFSVFQASYDTGYNDVGFNSTDEFIKFATDLQAQSKYKNNHVFSGGDRLLTLSTCTNGLKTDRYALMCVLTRFDPVSEDFWENF
ncbi:MAG: class B sortase [Clostridia bacterium]|nr:class B sortase [Clostridia bacterium]